jgi:hypothetical protein
VEDIAGNDRSGFIATDGQIHYLDRRPTGTDGGARGIRVCVPVQIGLEFDPQFRVGVESLLTAWVVPAVVAYKSVGC